jgi:hypothetical protein
MLAIAFLCWAANQLWPGLRRATLFNDIAIALFVLDVFLVMIGWPAAPSDESLAKTHVEQGEKPSGHALNRAQSISVWLKSTLKSTLWIKS